MCQSLAEWLPTGATIALYFSAGGLLLNALAFHGAAKTRDLEWLMRFLSDIQRLEGRISDSTSEEAREGAFTELLNYLEACCLALHKGLYPKRTRTVVEGHIVNTLATIRAVPHFADRIESLVTTVGTFADIRQFVSRHRPQIDAAHATIVASLQVAGTPTDNDQQGA